MVTLKGLSWGHRRATGPLLPLVERFRRDNPDVDVEWTVRPLSDFEHQGLAGVAEQFDLIIYDHPFSGDVVASAAFVPLDRHLTGLGAEDDGRFIGASLTSYRYAGAVWGAPIDGATQHALYRADLMRDRPLPVSWDDVLELGRSLRRDGLFLAMPCETPHAVLTVAALMANAGKPWSTDPALPFTIDRVGFGEALERVAAVLDYCPPEAIGWNSIDLHDEMAARDDLVYAPCVYGYATYGEPDIRKWLSFGPFPGAAAPHQAGTAIGGTAVGLSRHCKEQAAALKFIGFVLSDVAQGEITPAHHGQPAVTAGWDDKTTDVRFNGYFSSIRSTIDTAWIRPRLPGYPNFQKEAGIVVRRILAREIATEAGLDAIVALADKVNR